MTAFRRARWNFALERAADLARAWGRPLVVLEALRAGYPWASDRLHRFVIDGMRDQAREFEEAGVLYHPYVEPEPGAGRGLLAALAERACAVVTDDAPGFFLPRMLAAAARSVPARLEAVDSNGLLPLRSVGRVFPTAHAFRRHLQKNLAPHLAEFPKPDPLDGLAEPDALPREVTRRWPRADFDLDLARLPIDHAVRPSPIRGGSGAAPRVDLARCAEGRNHPDDDATSGLSPYLHFGHVSTHEVFSRIARAERWTPKRFGKRTDGSREGTWGMSPEAGAFLDQLVTWRELGYVMSTHRDDAWSYESLPPWSLRTLAAHAEDRREHVYALEDFEAARTHDPLWNAAQRQLVREGRLHNYLRMLWGKKILQWTATPREALAVMVELNNKHALDGRDPNSASGIFWVLGRYDRPWGPERPVFGTVRYMSSENAARKLRVREYLRRHS
jgi:deoxyribodipyrimidine photo-lyase